MTDPDRDDEEAPEPAARTGDAAVDRGLALLDGLDGRPLDEHAEVFADVHARLAAALDDAAAPAR